MIKSRSQTRLFPRLCSWNCDCLWIADRKRRFAKLRIISRLLQHTDVLLLQETATRQCDVVAARKWFERRGFYLQINVADDSGWAGIATAIRMSWVGSLRIVNTQGTAHHTMITHIGIQTASSDFEAFLSIANCYRKSGTESALEGLRLEQLRHLSFLLRDTAQQYLCRSVNPFLGLRRTCTLMGGDWNFISARCDRFIFKSDTTPGHWATSDSTASSRLFEDLFLEKGFKELHQEFITFRSKAGRFVWNNDRWCHNLPLTARASISMGTDLVVPPGELSDHGAVALHMRSGCARHRFPTHICSHHLHEPKVREAYEVWSQVPLGVFDRLRPLHCIIWEVAGDLRNETTAVSESCTELALTVSLFAKLHFGPRAGTSWSQHHADVMRLLIKLPAVQQMVSLSLDWQTKRWSYSWDEDEADKMLLNLNIRAQQSSDAASKRARDFVSEPWKLKEHRKFGGDNVVTTLRRLAGGGDRHWHALRGADDDDLYTADIDIVRITLSWWGSRFRHTPDLPADWDAFWEGYDRKFPPCSPPLSEDFSEGLAHASPSGVGTDEMPLQALVPIRDIVGDLCEGALLTMSSATTHSQRDAELPPTLNKMRLCLILKKISEFREGVGTVARVNEMRTISIATHFRRAIARGVNRTFTASARVFLSSSQYILGSTVDNTSRVSAHLEALRRRGVYGGAALMDVVQAFPSIHWGFILRMFCKIEVDDWLCFYIMSSFHRAYHEFSFGSCSQLGVWVFIGVLQGDPLFMNLFAVCQDAIIHRLNLRLDPFERIYSWADDLTFLTTSLLHLRRILEDMDFSALYTNLFFHKQKGCFVMATSS